MCLQSFKSEPWIKIGYTNSTILYTNISSHTQQYRTSVGFRNTELGIRKQKLNTGIYLSNYWYRYVRIFKKTYSFYIEKGNFIITVVFLDFKRAYETIDREKERFSDLTVKGAPINHVMYCWTFLNPSPYHDFKWFYLGPPYPLTDRVVRWIRILFHYFFNFN